MEDPNLGTVSGSRCPYPADGEGEMSDGDLSASGINFDAPATFRKWPSLNGQRIESAGAYLLLDGTLDECIGQFLAKPPAVRHLYEIHTSPQAPLVDAVVSGEIIAELARLRDFL
jgi:hypothetical protein